MILTTKPQFLSENKRTKRTNSIIGQAFVYDRLNDGLNPTDGVRVKLDLVSS